MSKKRRLTFIGGPAHGRTIDDVGPIAKVLVEGPNGDDTIAEYRGEKTAMGDRIYVAPSVEEKGWAIILPSDPFPFRQDMVAMIERESTRMLQGAAGAVLIVGWILGEQVVEILRNSPPYLLTEMIFAPESGKVGATHRSFIGYPVRISDIRPYVMELRWYVNTQMT